MDQLTKHSHKLAEELYKQAGGPAAGPTEGPGAAGPGQAPPRATWSTQDPVHGEG